MKKKRISTFKKTKSMATSVITSWQIDGGKEESDRFYFLGL